MSQYINRCDIKIAEIARLNFFEVQDVEKDPTGDLITDLAMHVECLRNIHTVIGETLAKYDENVKMQAETNKKMINSSGCGGIGIRKGLKIPRLNGLQVQVLLPAPK